MKKIKGIKGNILLSIGLLLVSIAFLLKDIVNTNVCDFITGFGLGIELVGIFKQCKENKKDIF